MTKFPHGEVSIRQSARTTKCPVAKCPTSKNPTAKSPATVWINHETSQQENSLVKSDLLIQLSLGVKLNEARKKERKNPVHLACTIAS